MKKLFIISILFLSCKKETITTNQNNIINHYTVSFKVSGDGYPLSQCFINGESVDVNEGYDVQTGDSVRIMSYQGAYTNTQTMVSTYKDQSTSIIINGVTKSKQSCNCKILQNKYNVN